MIIQAHKNRTTFSSFLSTFKSLRSETRGRSIQRAVRFIVRRPGSYWDSIEKIFSGDTVEELIAKAKEVLKTGGTMTTKRMAAPVPNDHAIGSEFVHVIAANKGGDGKPDGVIIFTENVSEKEAENSEKSEKATS